MEAKDLGFQVDSGRLKELGGLSQRKRWGLDGQAKMKENFADHCEIVDGGDRPYPATTPKTDGQVDREDALEPLSPFSLARLEAEIVFGLSDWMRH